MVRSRAALAAVGAILTVPAEAAAQQVVDSGYRAEVKAPEFPRGSGPVVAIDAAHQNFHTKDGRYGAFTRVLEADGFQVRSLAAPFTARSLEGIRALVIANAGMPEDGEWRLPARSAFTGDEVAAVGRWVEAGGALFLIADHMPGGGAAADLARRFGAEFTNGYTLQPRVDGLAGDRFMRKDGTLLDHPITRGRRPAERVDSVQTFVGQAFQIRDRLAALFRFGPEAVTWFPVRSGAGFDSLTPKIATPGWVHAAAGEFGKGRVVLMGEAGAFSAQLAGRERRPMGLNHPQSLGNQRFLLNVMHWLVRLY